MGPIAAAGKNDIRIIRLNNHRNIGPLVRCQRKNLTPIRTAILTAVQASAISTIPLGTGHRINDGAIGWRHADIDHRKIKIPALVHFGPGGTRVGGFVYGTGPIAAVDPAGADIGCPGIVRGDGQGLAESEIVALSATIRAIPLHVTVENVGSTFDRGPN